MLPSDFLDCQTLSGLFSGFQDFSYEKGQHLEPGVKKAAPPHGNKRNLFPSLPPVSFSIRGTEEGGGGGKVARSLSHNNVAKIWKKEEFLAPYMRVGAI